MADTLIYDEATARRLGLPWPPRDPRNDCRNYQWMEPLAYIDPGGRDGLATRGAGNFGADPDRQGRD